MTVHGCSCLTLKFWVSQSSEMNLDVPSLWVKAYTFDKSRFVWKSYKHSFREDPIKALPSVDFVQGFCSHFSFPVEDLSTSLLTLRIQWYLLSLDNQWTLLSEMPWDQGENLGWTRLIRTVLFFPFLVHRIFSFSSQFSVQDKLGKTQLQETEFSFFSCLISAVCTLSSYFSSF